MISRSILLLTPVALLGCVARRHSTTTHAQEEPAVVVDSVTAAHAGVDLTGSWATGSGAEPEARRVELRLECNYTPPLWILEQTGDTVSAFLVPESRAQGVRSRESPPHMPAKGRLSGMDLTLEMPGTRYALHYDSTSEHLRGTLNRAPFWAVRENIVHPADCIPPP